MYIIHLLFRETLSLYSRLKNSIWRSNYYDLRIKYYWKASFFGPSIIEMISVNFGICLVTICIEYKYILKGIPLTISLVSCILLPFFAAILRPHFLWCAHERPKKKRRRKKTIKGNRSCLEKKPTWVQALPTSKVPSSLSQASFDCRAAGDACFNACPFFLPFCCTVFVVFFWPTVFGQQEMADIRPAGTCLCCYAVILCSTPGQEMRQKNAFAVSMEFPCIHG